MGNRIDQTPQNNKRQSYKSHNSHKPVFQENKYDETELGEQWVVIEKNTIKPSSSILSLFLSSFSIYLTIDKMA